MADDRNPAPPEGPAVSVAQPSGEPTPAPADPVSQLEQRVDDLETRLDRIAPQHP